MSMDSFHRAIFAFWRNLNVNGTTYPVWLQGRVPDDAAFPYITFDISKASAFNETSLSVTLYLKTADGDSKNAERAAFFDAASKAIPESGARIDCGDGFCILYRSTGDFLSIMDDPEDKTIIGGRVGYEVTFYDM